MSLDDPAWRERPLRTAIRVATSLVLKRVAPRAVVPFDEGRSRIHADLATPLGLQLYRYGVHDPELELVRRLLSPGDLFVDGGANIGLFTLTAARRVGSTGTVIAFEPARATRAILDQNVALNDLSWVRVRPEALSRSDGTAELVAFAGTAAGLSSFAPELEGGVKEPVATVALDGLLGEAERRRLRLIKLDVEGAEVAALSGMRTILSERRPDLMIEVEPDHLARQGSSAEELIALLSSCGYAFLRVSHAAGRLAITPEADPARRVAGTSPNVVATTDPERVQRLGTA